MADVIWLGDEDPSAQVIDQYGYTFVKGQPTEVEDKDAAIAKLKDNPFFSFKKADPVDSKEPKPKDPDEGTEIAAVRKELDDMGVKYDGRSGIDTLRTKLAAEKAKAD